MRRQYRKKYYGNQLRWQKVTSISTLSLVLTGIVAIVVSICYNSKLIRESIESRVAENRPLIDVRKYPSFPRITNESMYLEIKNFGKGNAYNINYSYHYYDFFTKRIIFEYGTTHLDDQSFTVLSPGQVLSHFAEEDRKRFNILEPDGLPYIWAFEKSGEIKRAFTEDSTIIVCAVYVEYEDFKGNVFWTARQFGIMNYLSPIPTEPVMMYEAGSGKALKSPFMERARERAVKGMRDFEGPKIFDKKDLIQTEKHEDTLGQKGLK